MTEAVMEVRVNDSQLLPFSRSTREALKRWAKAEFSSYKAVARRFDLTLHQARTVIAGTATADTIDLIWRHKNGGLPVALPVILAVAGHGLDAFTSTERQRTAHERDRFAEQDARMASVAGDLCARLGLADRRRDLVADENVERSRKLDRRLGGRDD